MKLEGDLLNIEKVEEFNNIYQFDCFPKEFEKAVSEKKVTGRYHKWLRNRLEILDKFGKEALKLEQFEKLSNTHPDLYSIRYPHSKKNPRVIYIYLEGKNIYLLHAFLEKDANDYNHAIKSAEKRAELIT